VRCADRLYSALLDEDSWVASVDLTVGNASDDYAPCGSDGSFSQDDTRSEDTHGADPGSVVELNRGNHEPEAWVLPIMVTGAEVRSLRHAYAGANMNGGEVVDPAALTNPAVIPNYEMPGILDANAGLDNNPLTDPSPKEPEKMNSQ
jgi:hypothetical protein